MATTDQLASIRQAIEHTLHEFLMSYEDAAAQHDAAIISRSLAPDCVRHLGPTSLLRKLGLPTDIVFTNEQYQGLFAKESAAAAVKRSEISNVCVDAVARRASATTTYHGEFSDGEKHSLEFSWFLSFNETGTKVTKILEFVDSAEILNYQAKIESLLAKMGGGGA